MRAGGIMVMVASCLSALLVIAGLVYATGAGGRTQAAFAAAGCEPAGSPAGLPCTTTKMLTSQYMAVMTPASQQLSVDAVAYAASETRNLAAAEAALTAEVTTEHVFGTSLAGITFPPAIAAMAKALIRASQALAELTAEQARSSTLARLRSFDRRVQAASAAEQIGMNLIRQALLSAPQPS